MNRSPFGASAPQCPALRPARLNSGGLCVRFATLCQKFAFLRPRAARTRGGGLHLAFGLATVAVGQRLHSGAERSLSMKHATSIIACIAALTFVSMSIVIPAEARRGFSGGGHHVSRNVGRHYAGNVGRYAGRNVGHYAGGYYAGRNVGR